MKPASAFRAAPAGAGVGGFHAALHPAPDIGLPTGVEAELIQADWLRQWGGQGAGKATGGAPGTVRRGGLRCAATEQGDHAAPALCLMRHIEVAIDHRQKGRPGHSGLAACFGQMQGGHLHVQIGADDAAFQLGQFGIAKQRPPGIGHRLGSGTGCGMGVEIRLRQLGCGRGEIRPDRAAAEGEGGKGRQGGCQTHVEFFPYSITASWLDAATDTLAGLRSMNTSGRASAETSIISLKSST